MRSVITKILVPTAPALLMYCWAALPRRLYEPHRPVLTVRERADVVA